MLLETGEARLFRMDEWIHLLLRTGAEGGIALGIGLPNLTPRQARAELRPVAPSLACDLFASSCWFRFRAVIQAF